jgi:hypothetical protein
MKYILIIILLFFTGFVKGQDTNFFDNMGLRQGFCKIDNLVNFVKDEHVIKNINGYEYGYCIDNKKQGLFEFKDKKQHLIAYRWYNYDTLILEIHFLHKKPITMIRYRTKYKYTEDPDISNYVSIAKEIISFSKCGRIKKLVFILTKW